MALILALFAVSRAIAQAPEPPISPTGGVKVSLFAAEPDIVTPIGAAIDARGRLLVIESQSHFRPKDYKGPATDRIRILEDTTGSGKADKITTFFEGMNFLMNLAADRDGSVIVSSRNEIFRLSGGDVAPAAREKTTIAHLETKADYPHNGLHGLAIDREGNVFFSIGENLGGAYTLVGADGKKLSDDKGSGAIFRVDVKGAGLTLIARGFWNPFGLGFDPAGNLWTVDNDPDGRPPCRLIHVVPGGDYGFEFRYGRTGMHPLQAWDGELPGTLGMVAGVGEAPCAVVWHDGRLLVSSWRDHVVQAFTLTPRGASYAATLQTLVAGKESFRPVGMALAPDGSLFVNDWAANSYPVHGKGRVWKLSIDKQKDAPAAPLVNDAMRRAANLRQSENVGELIAALDDGDVVIAQAAQFGLSKLPAVEKIAWPSLLTSPRLRIGLMGAVLWRGSSAATYAAAALKDPDDRVRQMAVRCIAEQDLKELRGALEKLLTSDVLSPRLLGMTVAAIGQLDGDKNGKIDAAKINSVLMARLSAPDATDQAKAVALHMMLLTHPRMAMDKLSLFLQSPANALKTEAVWYLNDDSDPARLPLLAKVAADENIVNGVRAEAIVGLSEDSAAQVDLLLKLAGGTEPLLRHEALRSLRPIGAKLTPPQRQELAHLTGQYPRDADLVWRVTGTVGEPRPPETDIAAWQKIVDEQPGDANAGRRIFFHPNSAGCYHCHTIEGRGHAIGPDLSMIGHSQSREYILESILDPSREIAPLFTLWTITTRSGQKIDGMLLRRDGQSNEVYVDSAGKETTIKEPDVTDRKMRKESLMPTGLVQGWTDQELRDVLAYLVQKR